MIPEKKIIKDLEKELKMIQEHNQDLQIMYENTIEHGTAMENELEEKNQKINTLLNNMKRYLSAQVFDSIVGGKMNADLSYGRKKLTIFFSDIVGFTDLTDAVEPEVMSDFLNTYLNEMSKIATKHGGTIDKFIGDAVMIFFGAPDFKSDEEHAINCVQMALEMQERVHLLQQLWDQKGIRNKVLVRIGINTGYCTIGNFGSDERMDYTIVGGQVNIAARLEKFSKPGSVVISGSTYEYVKDLVNVKDLGEISVKGVHHPIDVFEVSGIKFKEKETFNPYIKYEGDEFVMEKMSYAPDITIKEEKKLMLKALEKAKEIISDQ